MVNSLVSKLRGYNLAIFVLVVSLLLMSYVAIRTTVKNSDLKQEKATLATELEIADKDLSARENELNGVSTELSNTKDQLELKERQAQQVQAYNRGLALWGSSFFPVDQTKLEYNTGEEYLKPPKLSGTWQDKKWELEIQPGDYVEIYDNDSSGNLVAVVDHFNYKEFTFYTERFTLVELPE